MASDVLGRQFIRTARRRWFSFCMADSTGRHLTFGRALVASLLLSRWIRRRMPHQEYIGLLLPASVGGALANVATSLAGKAPVNLNFTAGKDAMADAVDQCGITTIITSRTFLSKIGLDPSDNMLFLEDTLKQFGTFARLRMLVTAFLLPARLLGRRYASDGDAETVATVIFSSGSTGVPKGVMLTHRNILSNVDAVLQVFQLKDDDVLVGVLPFFHSFGFTGTIWLPLLGGFGAVYHPNPTDAKTIGELAGRHRATVLISTPTFCGAYIRKCTRDQFAHLRYAIVGAEKLREPVAKAFKDAFGLDLLEGYGCTEMSPIVAVNAPDATRAGSVGRPLPGVAAKVIDPATGEGPLIDREGLLLLNGPNRMKGYLGDAEKTQEVLRDGWYVTGDIATIDDAGFIRITDRLSRFSKIGGEMVPHMKVEQQIQELLDSHFTCVVTAIPDPGRGERLVAFYTDPSVTPHGLWEQLCRTELPRLWLPKREDLRPIEAIPTLGTGKVDLRAVRQLASELKCSS
jgi:acyl-[acyl-carrier-protein]-phospholipid O-acyltransferase/long-chain-fatty-acid--[acyl-carrier-protein] ligase